MTKKNPNPSNRIPTQEELAADWITAKQVERIAIDNRLEIERRMLALVEVPEKGTVRISLPSGSAVKITTGYDTKWNQEALVVVHENWPTDGFPFPFISDFKPQPFVLNALRERYPESYEKLVQDAAIQKPKKPSFSVD